MFDITAILGQPAKDAPQSTRPEYPDYQRDPDGHYRPFQSKWPHRREAAADDRRTPHAVLTIPIFDSIKPLSVL